MRTETRKKFEEIREIRDNCNKKLKEFEKIAENETERVIAKLEDISKNISNMTTSVIYELKTLEPSLKMLDIDDIIETYVYHLELGDTIKTSIEETIKALRRGLIG